jgi:undecaprenyl diphosphate synthase
VREAIEGCGELGVKFLTLYAFSTENWNRPKAEVTALMSLLVSAIKDEF